MKSQSLLSQPHKFLPQRHPQVLTPCASFWIQSLPTVRQRTCILFSFLYTNNSLVVTLRVSLILSQGAVHICTQKASLFFWPLTQFPFMWRSIHHVFNVPSVDEHLRSPNNRMAHMSFAQLHVSTRSSREGIPRNGIPGPEDICGRDFHRICQISCGGGGSGIHSHQHTGECQPLMPSPACWLSICNL